MALLRWDRTEAVQQRAVNWNQQQRDKLMGDIGEHVPRIPWHRFIANHFDWKPGEHIALIGPTGLGKTNLMMNLLPLSRFNVVFATKPADATMERLIREGDYTRLKRWVPGMSALDVPRRVLWPDARRIDSDKQQREVFQDAFGRIYREGGWTIAIDEAWWISVHLKLAHETRVMLQQGRSLGISMINATQRPKNVPLEIYSQSTHLFFWRDNDQEDLDRLSGINARDSRLVRVVVQNLERHQVLYINTRTGAMLRTRAPLLEGS